MPHTDQQLAAIKTPGNILVIAGAGTGKTSTLVERCLYLIREGCAVDELLMVTFTEAAAAEMRHRLRTALAEEIVKSVGEDEERAKHFEEQLALMDHAQVSTLHSFCLELIRRHFHLLGLDPQIRVLDETQTRPIMYDVMEEVMVRHYDSSGRDAVRELVRRSGSPSDDQVRTLVMKLYRYQQARANPSGWLNEQRNRFSSSEPVEWREWLDSEIRDWADEWLPFLNAQQGNANAERAADALEQLPKSSITREHILEMTAKIRSADSGWPNRKKTLFRKPIADLFAEASFWNSICAIEKDGLDPLSVDWANVRTDTLTLLELLEEFGDEYRRVKREMGGIDFSDLEQLALELLLDEDNDVAVACRDHFEHVFVDEYQDINAAQDAIIAAVTRPTGDEREGNGFLVGDIKQSIYRFRLAEPELFRSHAQNCSRSSMEGTVLPLSENFRSHEAILSAVNDCFTTITADTGIDYGANEALSVGAREERSQYLIESDPDDLCRVEYRCLTEPEHKVIREGPFDESEEEDDLDRDAREARWIAQRLMRIRREETAIINRQTSENECVEWRDMVVLMRSPGPRIETYAREFHRMGVPLQAKRPGFFDALEVMDQVNLLRILDNPRQDIPLLAVLRSPIGGFTVDELAEIRHTKRRILFWELLGEFHRNHSEEKEPILQSAWRKVDAFLTQFNEWRELVRHASLSYTLEVVIEGSHYERLLEGGIRSSEKRANLDKLLDLTRQFDPYQRQGLHRFLQFVDAQLEKGKDLDSAPPATANAVRLMSIHQSKGMEFPMVVLAGTGTEFNLRDLYEQVLFDERLGLCPKINDPNNETRYPSLPFWVAQRREKKLLLEEEMRLLYVAMTRARNYLIMTGSRRRTAPKLLKALTEKNAMGSPYKAGSMQDWITDWLWKLSAAEMEAGAGRNGFFRWEIGEPDWEQSSESGEDSPQSREVSKTDLEHIQRMLEWQYDWKDATREIAKTNVSELRGRAREAAEESVQQFGRSPFVAQPKQPDCSDRLTASEIGNAHHAFLELMELIPGQTALDLKNAAMQFRDLGLLEDRQIQALDFGRLARFWYTDVGQWVVAHHKNVHRELPFTTRFTRAELADLGIMLDGRAGDDDFIVVQGVVDLAVILDDEIRILDHKTDHFSRKSLKFKVADYAPQLQLYASALERIYRRKVTHAWLHFMTIGKTVDVISD